MAVNDNGERWAAKRTVVATTNNMNGGARQQALFLISLNPLYNSLCVFVLFCVHEERNRPDISQRSKKSQGNTPSLTSYMQTSENVKTFLDVSLMVSQIGYISNLLDIIFPRHGQRDIGQRGPNSDVPLPHVGKVYVFTNCIILLFLTCVRDTPRKSETII